MDAKGCFGPSCGKNFKAQTIDQAFKCSVGAKVKEDYDQCKCDVSIYHAFPCPCRCRTSILMSF